MKNRVGVYCLGLARMTAAGLCLFWGAFFIEHLQEWFLTENMARLPAFVWIAQGLHLLMIVSLALLIFRPTWGAVMTVVSTVAFFSWIGVRTFPYIGLLNLLPVVFVLLSRLFGSQKTSSTG
jgi:hypothetical protein